MLTEPQRQQLDGIVQKMQSEGQSDETIQFVVNDFKSKYDTDAQQQAAPNPDATSSPYQGAKDFMNDVDSGVMGKIAKYTTQPVIDYAGNAALRFGSTIYREGQAIGRLASGQGGNSDRDLYQPVGNDVLTKPGTTTPISQDKSQNADDTQTATDSLEPLQNLGQYVGNGIALGSTLSMFGGAGAAGAAENVATNELRSLVQKRFGNSIWQGMKTGGLIGGVTSLGGSLQDDNNNTKQVVGDTLAGTVGGAMLGSIPGVAGKIGDVTGATSLLNKAFTGATDAMSADTGNVFSKLRAGVNGAMQGSDEVPLTGAAKVVNNIKNNVATKLDENLQNNKFFDSQSPLAQTVLDNGLDKGDLHIIQTASPEDRGVFQKMITQAEENQTNPRATERPINSAGQTILDRVKFLSDQQKAAGKTIGAEIAKMPNEPIDVTDAYHKFLNDLEDAGIAVKSSDEGTTLDFSNSRLQGIKGGDNRGLLQSIFERLQPDENGKVTMTPKQIQAFRQSLFDDLKMASSQNTITDFPKTVASNFRDALDEPLRTLSPKYQAAAQKYAETTGAIKQFHDLIGSQYDFSSDSVKSLRAGEVANRVLGNASARPLSVLQTIEDTAKKYGLKSKNNPFDQILFADMLDDFMGNNRTRSLQGQVQRGVEAAAGGAQKVGEILKSGHPIAAAGKILGEVYQYGAETPQSIKVQALKDYIDSLGAKEPIIPKIGANSTKPKIDSGLFEEAKKYKSAEEFIKAQTQNPDYRSAHQLNLADSTTLDKINLSEIKEKIRELNGYISNQTLSDLNKLAKLQANPDTEVTIYRASPKKELNDGDWITTNKDYANNIKQQNGGKVFSYKVKISDLRYPNDIESLPSLARASAFSYSPKTSQLTDIWNKANKK